MSADGKWGIDVQETHPREGEAGQNVPPGGTTRASLKDASVSDKLRWIAQEAKRQPNLSFNNIMHLIDTRFLHAAYKRLNKRAKPGVDGVTAQDYDANIEENLESLYKRLREGRYIAPPVKRVYIEKEDGKNRPLGLPVFEDKIVQMAVSMVLTAIYDADFYDFSHGFRKGHSAHQALGEFRDACNAIRVCNVVDADVSGYFDNIDHRILKSLLRKRVSDKHMLRLISKWLHAGVMEGKVLSYSSKGTPQGGVISPVIANIYLHYVLDDWFMKQIIPALKGRAKLVRYADDFLVAFAEEHDARRFMAVLPKRFAKYGLAIHPEKSKLVTFKRPSASSKKDGHNGTFTFLGFTHYWGKTLKGYWVIKRQTAGKRLRRAIKAVWQWCKANRHINIVEQYEMLCSKLRGHYQYYGVRCNMRALEVYLHHVRKAWKRWLGRRHRNGYIPWEQFEMRLNTCFVLPKPRIIHNV